MTKQTFYLSPAISGVEGVVYIMPITKICNLNMKEQQVLGQISSQCILFKKIRFPIFFSNSIKNLQYEIESLFKL